MFENLSERLNRTFKNISGQGRFTEDNIKTSLREVRVALLEADVSLTIVKKFVDEVKRKALGQEVDLKLRPEQAFIKLVNDELINIMGKENSALDLKAQPPVVILLAGLQGSGKTTTAAKLALTLKEQKKKVMLASADIYRPAAIKQLEVLAKSIDVDFFPSTQTQQPQEIATKALDCAKKQYMDVLIFDTAGRLHIDDAMMREIKILHETLNPMSIFVVDSMMGQDAVNTAKAFNDAIDITGVILTKTDGDARGGAALSVKETTGKPILFLGTGEKIEPLEAFHPERVASRILGMGDMISLIEEVERKSDKKKSEKLAKKLKKGVGFNLEDYKAQLEQMNSMGGVAGMMNKLPGMNQLTSGQLDDKAEDTTKNTIAIINSMTNLERRRPKILLDARASSRRNRIAKGAGKDPKDVRKLLKQFEQMQKMMKKVSRPGGMQKMMRGMEGMMGNMDSFKHMFKNKKD